MDDHRIGIGWDIHRLVPGRRLVLGGVEVPSPAGFDTHSDGDVLSHAVVDALAGAVADGDLGVHFPEDDPDADEARSLDFVVAFAERVRERGLEISSLDSFVVLGTVRLRPHLDAMRVNLADALRAPLDRISVKARSADGLGPEGRGEAASASVSLLLRPVVGRPEGEGQTGAMTSSAPGTDAETDDRPALQVHGELLPRFDEILTPDALAFVAELAQRFGGRRDELLRARVDRYAAGRPGDRLDFLEETAAIRSDPSWRVAPPAPGLEDRRVEMTGPTTRKMVINALNSGARAWMADFEDATSPTWFNVVDGQLNLYDAIRGQVDFTDERGKRYEVGDQTPTIMVRPRGWHLDEDHLRVRGRAVPGSLVDLGLYLFHNAEALIAGGTGPYFYLPKLENHLEARLWNDVFTFAEERLDLAYGTIRATCLIETTPAAFEMEEILYELRDHSSGLNAGRWDYIFSMIKNFAEDADHVLPDRSQVTMTSPFMAAYADLLVRTCHARGAHAIGGMAAFVPSRSNPEATTAALEKTTTDKSREAGLGFDGSWVAHPALVQTCLDAFVAVLGDRPHQLERQRPDVAVTRTDLVDVSTTGGDVTLDGLRTNVRISLEYLSAWVGGAGAVAIDNLMEDAATVEISRMQIWHWLRHRIRAVDGTEVTQDLVRSILTEVSGTLAADVDEAGAQRLAAAREVFEQTCLVQAWPQFFTGYAYEHFLVEQGLVEQGLVEQGLVEQTGTASA